MADIDQRAMEAAMIAANDAANDDDTDHKAIMEAAILAYLAHETVSEEMVERCARAMRPKHFATFDGGYTQRNVIEHMAFLNAEKIVKRARKDARACLTASRQQGNQDR